MVYKLLLFVHVFSTVISIGPFFVLLPMVKKLKNARADEIGIYLGVFDSAIRLVKHSGHILVISGVLLVYNSGWTWSESWILLTLAVMLCSVYFLAGAFSPTLNKINNNEYDLIHLVKKLHRSLWIYIGLLIIMLWFMIAKPRLW